ncbi:MAG: alpha-keto acid decarboxylase family protein [Mycobacterium sp.]|nr:alpha-keto acid decarboxylase family protein [Mycobacterium sp.]
MPCAAPGPVSAILEEEPSDQQSLHAAITAAAEFLHGKQKPVILIGSKLRSAKGEGAAVEFAEALGCAVTVMAAAKSFFPEDHPQFAGIYWGEVSTHGAREIVDWSDATVCLGPIFNDYSTVGWTAVPNPRHLLTVDTDSVSLEDEHFGRVRLRDFLSGLARKVEKRDATMIEYKRIASTRAPGKAAAPDTKLTRSEIMRQLRPLVTEKASLIAETGDSWFNAMKLDLPGGARVEFEMQWGHIGWSVPAAFGYALGAPERRVILMVGDGSFQLTGQELAQMIRHNLPVIVFLINNRGYTIEVEIHDGPYNNIKNWDYAGLVDVFNADDGRGRGLRAKTAGELTDAIKVALENQDGPTLIECAIDRDDCSAELISWGRQVAAANGRPPRTV